MFVNKLAQGIVATLVFTVPLVAESGKPAPIRPTANTEESAARKGTATLWRDPRDVSSRNLFYGPGGKAHEPHGPFTFVKEDLDGTNPKFVVRDQRNVKWKVKLGNEARPETVATRIAWAVGFYANEDYFLPELRVNSLPPHLHRGQKLVLPGGVFHDVRLKREDEKKVGDWEWRDNPFSGTREWNGLRVVMALINNWDLKDANNSIYKQGSEQVYMVTDLGATFGSASRTWPKDKSKGNLESYEKSKFVVKVGEGSVNFRTPARPSFVYFVNPKEYFQRIHLEWIGKNIPVEDARWMGKLLAKLSSAQIRDAFRAGGYTQEQVEAFSRVLETRIRQLTDL